MSLGVITRASIIGALTMASTVVTAAPVDLTSWTANGSGNWNVQSGNTSVLQTINRYPTVFHNGVDSQGQQLSGEITVQTRSDDDFIGFVLGYEDGDLSNANADYLLIDWKQADQGAGKEGLAISRVTGAIGSNTLTNSDAWGHTGVITELARGTSLGSTGWNDNQKYTFDLVFTSSLVEVKVNNITELSIMGNFDNGAFGFYNNSQADVLYAGITQVVAPPPPNAVPVPAAAWLFGSGLLSFAGIRRNKK